MISHVHYTQYTTATLLMSVRFAPKDNILIGENLCLSVICVLTTAEIRSYRPRNCKKALENIQRRSDKGKVTVTPSKINR